MLSLLCRSSSTGHASIPLAAVEKKKKKRWSLVDGIDERNSCTSTANAHSCDKRSFTGSRSDVMQTRLAFRVCENTNVFDQSSLHGESCGGYEAMMRPAVLKERTMKAIMEYEDDKYARVSTPRYVAVIPRGSECGVSFTRSTRACRTHQGNGENGRLDERNGGEVEGDDDPRMVRNAVLYLREPVRIDRARCPRCTVLEVDCKTLKRGGHREVSASV